MMLSMGAILISFLSTLSLRRATKSNKLAGQNYKISIHALLAESDYTNPETCSSVLNFYPRSPCGERLLGRVVVV